MSSTDLTEEMFLFCISQSKTLVMGCEYGSKLVNKFSYIVFLHWSGMMGTWTLGENKANCT